MDEGLEGVNVGAAATEDKEQSGSPDLRNIERGGRQRWIRLRRALMDGCYRTIRSNVSIGFLIIPSLAKARGRGVVRHSGGETVGIEGSALMLSSIRFNAPVSSVRGYGRYPESRSLEMQELNDQMTTKLNRSLCHLKTILSLRISFLIFPSNKICSTRNHTSLRLCQSALKLERAFQFMPLTD